MISRSPVLPLVRRTAIALCVLMALTLASPPRAHAVINPAFRRVLILSLYGLGIGTAAGLVAWPLSGNARSLFMGSSIGLYAGTAFGVYYVLNPYNPDNPIHQDPPPPAPWEKRYDDSHLSPPPSLSAAHGPVIALQLPVFEF